MIKPERVRKIRGIAYGIASFAVGYLAFHILFVTRKLQNRGEYEILSAALGFDPSVASQLPDVHQITLWFYVATHFVPVGIQGDSPLLRVGRSVDLTAAPVWEPYYHLIPVVIVGIAGFLYVKRGSHRGSFVPIRAGVTILLGYLVAAIGVYQIAVWEFTIDADSPLRSTYVVRPALSIFTTGLLFPAILGSIGGFVAGLTSD